MSTIAKWRKKKWKVSSNGIVDLTGLTYSFAQLADNNSSTEGAALSNKKGLELFKLSFNTTLHSGTGINVRKEINEWKALVTKSGQFFLNGKKLGPKVRLDKVSVSDIRTDNKGKMLYAVLQFNFVEYEKKKATNNSTSSSAKNVTASSADKDELKKDSAAVKGAKTTGISTGSYVKPTTKVDLDGNPVSSSDRDRAYKVVEVNDTTVTLQKGLTTSKLGKTSVSLT